MKWELSESKDLGIMQSMHRKEVPASILADIRPGDAVCVVFNKTVNMWCKVMMRHLDKASFICSTSYSISRLGIRRKQSILVKGSQVINVLAGINHKKPWECIN